MEDQARFLPSEQEVVKILMDPPPVPEVIQAPAPGLEGTPSIPLPVETQPEANPKEDSAWAALAGAAIILNPLLEDLAATHLSRQRNGAQAEEKLRVRRPRLEGWADEDEPGAPGI
jgi:hypothetical protein